jgi:hypothetical protein
MKKQLVAYLLLVAAMGYTQLQVRDTQNKLTTSEKSSINQRVITVTQRCELTKLLLNDLPARNSAPLAASLAGCEHQLKIVKGIASHTP